MSSSSLSDAHLNDHVQQQHPQNVITAFLAKLWALVNDSTCDDLIAWDPSGGSFHVYDQARFAREILPRYFKHNNFASFIRQLNMYGFRKISTIEHGSLKNERDDIEFAHPSFIRGQDNLLESIKRRAPENQPKPSLPTIKTEIPATPMPAANHLGTPSTSESSTVRPVEFGQILTDVRNLKSKQSSLSDKLFHLEDENQALWREISLLRQKHAKQQQIVSKLMEFLLHILTNSTQNHRRSVEQPGGSAAERTSAPHSTINLATHSLKRKPAALMHGDSPNKRPHPHHLQTPLDGLTPPQSIVINELSDTDTGLWAPIVTTMKNPSPVVDFVPSPPPSSSVQHRDEKYSPTQTTYEWIVPGDELLNNVSRPPTGSSRSLRTVENLHDKDETPFLPDFFLTTPDESNGFQNHDPISLNALDSSRTSPSKHLSHLKEEEIELVNRFPPFPSSSTVNNIPNNDPGRLDNPSLSLDEFSSQVDSIQSSLDNIREFMFNKLPDGTSIDDLFDEEHVLLSPNFPATSNLLTDPIHVEDNKPNTDFLYADSSSHIPPMENHLLAQLMQHSTKIDEQRRASTRK